MQLTFRSFIEYSLLSIPAYIFILSPLITILFPSKSPSSYQSFQKTDSFVLPSTNLTCPPHTYTVSLLSRSPLVVYIHNFLSAHEAKHLVDLAEPHYTPSPINHQNVEVVDTTVRNSSRALLPRTNEVQCIEARAYEFQGAPEDVFIERLWAQKYTAGGKYVHHYDWSGDLRTRGAGRISTFMVYAGCEGCVGGGTEFPRLQRPTGGAWCDVIECDGAEGDRLGVTFKPLAGNAIYWENFSPEGRGWEELWHAGLPVEEGTKVGLNLWSWYQPGYKEALRQQQSKESEERREL